VVLTIFYKTPQAFNKRRWGNFRESQQCVFGKGGVVRQQGGAEGVMQLCGLFGQAAEQ
jgi:hypothetical protein